VKPFKCRYCGDAILPIRDVVGVTRRSDALEAEALRIVRALAMLDDDELDAQRPDRILKGIGVFEFPGSRMRKRRHLQARDMLFAERLRRRTRTAHEVVADRVARARLFLGMDAAA